MGLHTEEEEMTSTIEITIRAIKALELAGEIGEIWEELCNRVIGAYEELDNCEAAYFWKKHMEDIITPG